MARSGQTVVLSGLIQESKGESARGAPFLSNLPLVGPLFGFNSDSASRTELLIILKPYIVNDGDDSIRQHNNEEFDRMHWCMCDVAELFGSTNYDDSSSFEAPMTVYPDSDPAGMNPIRHEVFPGETGFERPSFEQAPPVDFETSGNQTPKPESKPHGLLDQIRHANKLRKLKKSGSSNSQP